MTRGQSRGRDVIVAMLMATSATGCTKWVVARGPTPAAASEAVAKNIGEIRVELKSGVVLLLARPELSADSIVGEDASLAKSGRMAVPADDVENIEYKTVDGQVPAGVVFALLIGTLVGVGVLLILGALLGAG